MSSHLNPTIFKMPSRRGKDQAAFKHTALSSFIDPQQEDLAREVLADVQKNGQLLRQISTLDEQIERMQKSIAELAVEYQCVDALQRNAGEYNHLSNQNQNGDFLGQRDLRDRLLPRLQNIKTLSQSVTTFELLGLDCKLQAQSTTSREIPLHSHLSQASNAFSSKERGSEGRAELE